MKKLFPLLLFFLTAVSATAQETYFQKDGLWYRVLKTMTQKSYDASVDEVAVTRPPSNPFKYQQGISINVPSNVTYNGKNYAVTYLDAWAFSGTTLTALTFPESIQKTGTNVITYTTIKHFHTPQNVKVLPLDFLWKAYPEELWLSPNVTKMENRVATYCSTLQRVHGFAQTKIEEIGESCFPYYNDRPDPTAYINDFSVLPPTIRIIGSGAFSGEKINNQGLPLNNLSIPLSLEKLGNRVFDIADKVIIPHQMPFEIGEESFGIQSTLKLHVPTDRIFAYKASIKWSAYGDKLREDLKIGSTGYTSYYLENENFLIPAGCTAYIITGITPSGSKFIPDQANVTAFTAGKIIPKQTGFILQGTPNSTVVYQANVTGTEESVAGNWLVGTAIEQEFSSAGHKYYVLANGDEGIGFYKQGTRKGASIKLQPHRAGLRLPDAVAPAKGLIIDFDAAREEAETTGIRDVRPSVQPREDIIYDLQGRRVTNPGRGIYIVNGKKVVRE